MQRSRVSRIDTLACGHISSPLLDMRVDEQSFSLCRSQLAARVPGEKRCPSVRPTLISPARRLLVVYYNVCFRVCRRILINKVLCIDTNAERINSTSKVKLLPSQSQGALEWL